MQRWLLLLVAAAIVHQGLVAQIHFFAHDADALRHGHADAAFEWHTVRGDLPPAPSLVDSLCPICQVLHPGTAALVEDVVLFAPPARHEIAVAALPAELLIGTPANLRPYPRSPPLA